LHACMYIEIPLGPAQATACTLAFAQKYNATDVKKQIQCCRCQKRKKYNVGRWTPHITFARLNPDGSSMLDVFRSTEK